MPEQYYDMRNRQREFKFHFPVLGVYYCYNWTPVVEYGMPIKEGLVEISFRLRSASGTRCMDEYNGEPCNIPFPHVLVKRPGNLIKLSQLAPRDTISFQYPVSMVDELRRLDMLPDMDMWEIRLTPEIEGLLAEFQHCLYTFYADEVPDKLDWICFKLLRELSHNQLPRGENEDTIIKNSSVWLQMHFNEKFTVDDLARCCGMSRSNFYMLWKKNFDVSPIQYVLDMRLQAAAALLRETPFPVSRIADKVGFCSTDNFHRKFKARYNMTPAEYRKANREPDQ